MNSKILDVVLNYTPHDIVLISQDGLKTVIPSSGIARVSTNQVKVGDMFGFPLKKEFLGHVFDLPDYNEGVFLIVSRLVKAALPDRVDLIVPDTANACRDDKGKIIGVSGFVG